MSDSNAKPLVLIFSTAYLPMVGGAELAIRDITDRIADRFEFILFTARIRRAYPPRERVGAVEVRRLGFGAPLDKYLFPFLVFIAARPFLPRARAIWGMMASFGGVGAYFLKKRNPRIPFLLTLQEGDPEEYLLRGRFGLMGFWFGRIVRAADRIQTISAYLKRVAVKAGTEFNRVDVVPNGVDLAVFGREWPEGTRAGVLNELGIPHNKKIAITASRFVRKNAVDVIIRAMADVAGEHLIIAGAGPDEAKLRSLARELKLDSRIHFVGEKSHAELSRYFAASHVFVRPSRSEGLGSAFLEAMAAGLAVIGTSVGGIPDFLRHNETGVIVRVDDTADLAYQLKHVFYDADFREKISAAGKKLAHATYSWDGIARSVGGILYRMMYS